MGDHKFKIGQLVDYIGRQRAAGVYTVTARLPSEDDDCRYRIKKSTKLTSAWQKRASFGASSGSSRRNS